MQQSRRSSIQIMAKLIVLIKPLLPTMLAAIILGVLGFLCAIFLTIFAGYQLIKGAFALVDAPLTTGSGGFFLGADPGIVCIALIVMAVFRGIFHYGEQYCNHYIAFKLLAIIRNKVFTALRKICPAKLEGKDKGNLISIITTDIELLEVFYAHTISPIAIAIITSLVMVCFFGSYSIIAALLAALGYITIGVIIPVYHGRLGNDKGMSYRSQFGDLNSFVLESLRGIDETIQYGCGQERIAQMEEKSRKLSDLQKQLNKIEASQKSLTTAAILTFSFAMLFLMLFLGAHSQVSFEVILIATIAMMGSFGPVVALANLSNNLNQTLASGQRVLSILEEKPMVYEVEGKENISFESVQVENVDFAYNKEKILDCYSIDIPKGKIVGIHGASGSGKSTLLKLLMRFWDVDGGSIKISNKNICEINTSNLRDMESYVTQETHLFCDSIANNIKIGNIHATREEIVEAARKASVHEFIMSLPQGYDTEVGELGDTLSGGEKQRIGIARAFLHDAPFLLLDEPTSNLDSLNEGFILKSLSDECQEKTVVLVSHRKSTMNVADVVFSKN